MNTITRSKVIVSTDTDKIVKEGWPPRPSLLRTTA
jgi:hypothetical protein